MRWPPLSPNVWLNCPRIPPDELGSCDPNMKFGWLNRLKKFAWKVKADDSVILNFLVALKSTMVFLGPKRVLRPTGALHQKPSFSEAGHVKRCHLLLSK